MAGVRTREGSTRFLVWSIAMLASSWVSFCASSRDVHPLKPADGPTESAQPATSEKSTPPPVRSFAVYALSRGKGVPPEAREALRHVVELAEKDQRRGVKVTVTTTRIGIEGETRVCVAYEDPQQGARAYERARAIVKNVDLVNLAEEPCREAANNKEEKKS